MAELLAAVQCCYSRSTWLECVRSPSRSIVLQKAVVCLEPGAEAAQADHVVGSLSVVCQNRAKIIRTFVLSYLSLRRDKCDRTEGPSSKKRVVLAR